MIRGEGRRGVEGRRERVVRRSERRKGRGKEEEEGSTKVSDLKNVIEPL